MLFDDDYAVFDQETGEQLSDWTSYLEAWEWLNIAFRDHAGYWGDQYHVMRVRSRLSVDMETC